MVADGSRVAYDVLVFVGQALFQRHRCATEVRRELARRGVHISDSEVGYLGRQFICRLSVAHKYAKPRLREMMIKRGGYILQVDGMHEGGAPVLMCGIDGLSRMILANDKVLSEHADHIKPFLIGIKRDFGTPIAVIHDMGTGIQKAVEEVFPYPVLVFICHYHFLRDIGKDFLGADYEKLRGALSGHAASSRLHAFARDMRQRISEQCADIKGLAAFIGGSGAKPKEAELEHCGIAYALSMWCLRGKHVGDGYGFPFDRPHLSFAERILAINKKLTESRCAGPSEDRRKIDPLAKLREIVAVVAEDIIVIQAMEELRWRTGVFDELRSAMRIAEPGGKEGLNDGDAIVDMKSIRTSVIAFREMIDLNPMTAHDKRARKMAEQIDKYGDKLFADPINVSTPEGSKLIYPQRTNNYMEHTFREERKNHRRKTGNDAMSQKLQTMLADTLLVKNLNDAQYLELLLDGHASLAELFAEQDTIYRKEMRLREPDPEKILPGFKTIVDAQSMPATFPRSAQPQAMKRKSNRVLRP